MLGRNHTAPGESNPRAHENRFDWFLWLAWPPGSYNPQVRRVFLADIAALVCLVLGAIALGYLRREG